MYSYLDQDNDWLGFGPLSQRIKSTTLKPHNVLGYINFDNFNEKNSSLKITNERSNFYQNASFKKFIEILKDIIVKIIFEIDVAYRNNNIKYPENVVVSSTSISNPSSDKTSELGPDKTSEPDTKVTMKKHTTKFFTKSTVLKSPLPVSIPFNDLINQLKTINCNNKLN